MKQRLRNLLFMLPVFIGQAPASAFAYQASASTNIELTGTIVALGCTVDPGDVNKPVILGDWVTTQLKKAGDHTKPYAFSIHLTGCAVNGVTVAFSGQKDAHDATLLALDAEATAQGVAVQIMDAKQNRIAMGDNAPEAVPDANGDATLNFLANYVSTQDRVTGGSASADTEFTLSYD